MLVKCQNEARARKKGCTRCSCKSGGGGKNCLPYYVFQGISLVRGIPAQYNDKSKGQEEDGTLPSEACVYNCNFDIFQYILVQSITNNMPCAIRHYLRGYQIFTSHVSVELYRNFSGAVLLGYFFLCFICFCARNQA